MTSPSRTDVLTEWDAFVLRHQKSSNLRFHCVSVLLFWGSPLLAIVFWQPLILIGFFLSSSVGTLGHYLTKDGKVDAREATSSVQAVRFSSKAVLLYLHGSYPKHIETANQKFRRFLRNEISSAVDPSYFKKINRSEWIQ